MSRLPTTIWQGTFTLLGVSLRCYTLDDGQRVIDAGDMVKFIEALESSATVIDPGEVERFAKWKAGGVS